MECRDSRRGPGGFPAGVNGRRRRHADRSRPPRRSARNRRPPPAHPPCTLYGRATTYAALAEQSRRLAHALQRFGAGPGRFVGLLLPNTPEYLAAMQATWLTGATVLQLSPLMVAEEVRHWLEL